MPDRRRHRGPHGADRKLFEGAEVASLTAATRDLSWLLSRGYAGTAALELVGDRHGLRARQRTALRRSACSDGALADRRGRLERVLSGALAGRRLAIDGFNVLVTTEAALAGGVVLIGRDGACRDLASVHGSYRKVEETRAAIERIGAVLDAAGVGRSTWYLDAPVSNSGRLRALLLEHSERAGWPWTVELVPDPDRVLAGTDDVVATSDSATLDACGAWVDLPGAVIATSLTDAWVVDLSEEALAKAERASAADGGDGRPQGHASIRAT